MKRQILAITMLMAMLFGIFPGLSQTAYAEQGGENIGELLISSMITTNGAPKGNADPTKGTVTVKIGDGALKTAGSYTALLTHFLKNGQIYEKSKAIDNIITDPPKTDGSNAFSITNIQVQDVDEPDVLKTDGKYLYYISGKSISVYSTGLSPKCVARIQPPGSPYNMEIFLQDDRLVVIAQTYDMLASNMTSPCHYTSYLIYDVSRPSSPKLLRELRIQGGNTACRLLNNKLYFTQSGWRSNVPYEESRLFDILPCYYDSLQGKAPVLLAPENIYMESENSGISNCTMLGAFDIRAQTQPNVQAYLGSSSQTYMNKEALYITQTDYTSKSKVLRFQLHNGNVDYAVMGNITGNPINQYAMDEYKGDFRIATVNWNNQTNTLYVLDKNTLHVKGSVSMAKGESIQSVRFMQNTAYVVTYERVDPLFVIDVSSSTPKILGELKIPGFSNYLHPFKEGYVLGIGPHTTAVYTKNAQGEFMETDDDPITTGIKLSLFDVRDAKNPKEIQQYIVGDKPGYFSFASENPRSIMVDTKKSLFALPIAYELEGNSSEEFYGGMVFHVDEKKGIQPVLRVQGPHSMYDAEDSRFCYVGNTLYYLYGNNIQAFDYRKIKK